MNILIVNTFYYPNLVGGTENSIKLLAEELVLQGNNVAVFTVDSQKGFYSEKINNVTIYRSNGKNVYNSLADKNGVKKLIYKIIEMRNYFVLSDLKKVLDEFKPDVAHTNNLFNMSPLILKYIKERNIKIVHTLRDYWFICPKSTLLNIKGDPCTKYCTEHNAFSCLSHVVYRDYFKSFTKYIDTVTAPSQFTLDLFVNMGYFRHNNTICIPNAIDFDENEVKNIINERMRKKKNIVNYLFIGNLLKSKGIQYLIESFKCTKNENSRLIICGDGDLKDYVRKSVLSDNRIIYKGAIYEEEKKNVLLESDVLIIPSIWYEPFGRVIIEAYKYGMPVIGTNMGGIPEIIDKDVSGVVISALNKDELIDAINHFSDTEVIKKYLINLPQKLNEYSLEKQINKFIEIYK